MINTYDVPVESIVHETSVDFVNDNKYRSINLKKDILLFTQYDKSLPIVKVKLFKNSTEYVLPANADMSVRFGKPDGTFVIKDVLGCDSDRKCVYFDFDEQMSYFFGVFNPILELKIGNKIAGSSSITFTIEKNPVQETDIKSSSEYLDLEKKINEAYTANKPFSSLTEHNKYLYSVVFDKQDEAFALKYFKERNTINIGACSGVRKNSNVLRLFDWLYNDQVEFVIKTNHDFTHYASLSVASHGSLTSAVINDVLKNGLNKDTYTLFNILPFMVQDGINEHGLYAQINVTSIREGEELYVDNNSDVEVSQINIPKYLLDHAKDVDEAIDILNSINIYPINNLTEQNYKAHYLLCDSNTSCVVEISNGSIVVIEKPYFTNFGLDGVTFNPENDIVYTPANQESGTATEMGIDIYGSGLERWNTIVNRYSELEDKSDFKTLAEELKYSDSYKKNDIFKGWYTEFVGNDLTVDSKPEEFEDIIDIESQVWEERSRENPNGCWHTLHAAIYDLDEKTIDIYSQENFNKKYEFKL